MKKYWCYNEGSLYLPHIDETVLLDLKHLLIEAKQKIPPFLAAIQPENEKYLDIGGKLIFYSLEMSHILCKQTRPSLSAI